MPDNIEQETGVDALSQILQMGDSAPVPALPLYSFLSPSRPAKLTQEEVIIRQVFINLDGRRWGYARKERERLLALTQQKGGSPVPVYLLEVLSDIFEGKIARALNVYERAFKEPTALAYSLDFYILRELIIYLKDAGAKVPSELLTDDQKAQTTWFFSPVANALYRSKFETSNSAINELGQIADALINEPGTKRFLAVLLRGLQGNRLLERGEYAWAERVLGYTAERAEKLAGFNDALVEAVHRDRAIAHSSVAHLSYQ